MLDLRYKLLNPNLVVIVLDNQGKKICWKRMSPFVTVINCSRRILFNVNKCRVVKKIFIEITVGPYRCITLCYIIWWKKLVGFKLSLIVEKDTNFLLKSFSPLSLIFPILALNREFIHKPKYEQNYCDSGTTWWVDYQWTRQSNLLFLNRYR